MRIIFWNLHWLILRYIIHVPHRNAKRHSRRLVISNACLYHTFRVSRSTSVHLQGDCFILDVGPVDCPETSVTTNVASQKSGDLSHK